MKFGNKLIVAAVLVAFFCSVASAGNVNPVSISMEGNSIMGPGPGQDGPVEGELRGHVDSDQELKFHTTSPWHVGVSEGELMENGFVVDSFFDVFVEIEVGDTTGENNVNRTNREILTEIGRVRQNPAWNPGSWDTDENYTITLKYWLYSDEKMGNTYIIDIITFTWDSLNNKWIQTHQVKIWSDGQAEIPEFPTVAVPVVAVIGLMFLFSRRSGYN